jgi:hypothetical protein
MISPPTILVDVPQEVVQTSSACPRRRRNRCRTLGQNFDRARARYPSEGFAIACHRFERVGARRAREALAIGLAADDDGDCQELAHVPLIHLVVNLQRVRLGVLFAGVSGVALLPKKFARAQEQTRPHLPPHDVGPLVEQQRQVAIGVDPLGHELTDHGLARRPHDDRLGQLFAAAVGHHRELR